jgi:hypothetical protein
MLRTALLTSRIIRTNLPYRITTYQPLFTRQLTNDTKLASGSTVNYRGVLYVPKLDNTTLKRDINLTPEEKTLVENFRNSTDMKLTPKEKILINNFRTAQNIQTNNINKARYWVLLFCLTLFLGPGVLIIAFIIWLLS